MKKIIFILLILMSTDFWAFRPWIEMPESPVIIQIIGFILLLFSFVFLLRDTYSIFRKELLFYLLTFVFSAFSSYYLYGQDFYLSLKGSMPYAFALGIYFLAHKYELSSDFVYKLLIGFSAVFICIEIVEQFTYPNYLFCGRTEKGSDELEVRMGLWRVYVFGINYCLLAFALTLQRVLYREKIVRNLVLLIFLFIGIVVFSARKDIYAALSIILIGLLLSTQVRHKANTTILVVVILAAVLYQFAPNISEINEQSINDVSNEDYIRYLAAGYFLYGMNTSPLYYIFGAGIPTSGSSLSKLIQDLSETWGFYQADCGFIGYMSMLGVIGLVPYFLIIYKIVRNHRYVDLSLQLFGIMMLELCFFDFWGLTTRNAAATMLYLYLVDVNINENRLYEEEQYEEEQYEEGTQYENCIV